ncbi:hypothetical protein Droror1_Dr00017806 [Drosera rotundifolia]
MFNGVGLQTPRGSGSNEYIQSNKFLLKSKVAKFSIRGDDYDNKPDGILVSKKRNKEIVDHDRRRQIEAKLIEQGCNESEIAVELAKARRLEDEAAKATADQEDRAAVRW